MKAVILAGGLGSRITEESILKPKPMIEIGGRPILWHILKIYSHFGINDFLICCGYKGYIIKEYFANYYMHMSDITFDLKNNKIRIHKNTSESWNITLIDTGLNTMTGGRLKQLAPYLLDDDFCFTYGDGLANINLSELLEFHSSHSGLVTVTAVQPPGRYGGIISDNAIVKSFREKLDTEGLWVNGGFFVMSPKILGYINGDSSILEEEVLTNLAKDRMLYSYKHFGFWHAMDTLKDKNTLEELWTLNKAPWKVWD
jgi:glucose-1-phosphate cytidylyltransferase